MGHGVAVCFLSHIFLSWKNDFSIQKDHVIVLCSPSDPNSATGLFARHPFWSEYAFHIKMLFYLPVDFLCFFLVRAPYSVEKLVIS